MSTLLFNAPHCYWSSAMVWGPVSKYADMQKLLLNARFEAIENVGHFLLPEQPDEVITLHQTFFFK